MVAFAIFTADSAVQLTSDWAVYLTAPLLTASFVTEVVAWSMAADLVPDAQDQARIFPVLMVIFSGKLPATLGVSCHDITCWHLGCILPRVPAISLRTGTGKFSSAPTGAVAAHGAASASAAVPAGETVTLSIVFSWHFPDRDYKASNDHSTDGLILGVSLPPASLSDVRKV